MKRAFVALSVLAAGVTAFSHLLLAQRWPAAPPTPVSTPEIDGAGSIAVMALLASLGALLYSRIKR
jgi:hypothetical protein